MNVVPMVSNEDRAIRDAMEKIGSFEAMVEDCHIEIVKSRDATEQLARSASLSEEQREKIARKAGEAADRAVSAITAVARADEMRREDCAREGPCIRFWDQLPEEYAVLIGGYKDCGEQVCTISTDRFLTISNLQHLQLTIADEDEFLNAVEENIRLAYEACGPQAVVEVAFSFDRFAPSEDGAELVQSRPQGDRWVAGGLISPFGPRLYARQPTAKDVFKAAKSKCSTVD